MDGAETTAISPCHSQHKLLLASSVEPRRILLVADNQFRRSTFRRLLRVARSLQPHLVLHVGDAVGNGERAKEWRFDWWLPLTELGLPLLMARGNHDGEGALAHALTDLPYELERDSRSYTLGGVHFSLVPVRLTFFSGQLQLPQPGLSVPDCLGSQRRHTLRLALENSGLTLSLLRGLLAGEGTLHWGALDAQGLAALHAVNTPAQTQEL